MEKANIRKVTWIDRRTREKETKMNKNITIDDYMMDYESDMNRTVHMAADLIKRRFIEESYNEAIKYSNNMCDSVLKLLRKDYDHIIGKIQYYFIELQRINKEEYDELMSHALNRFDFWQNTTIMNFWRGALKNDRV